MKSLGWEETWIDDGRVRPQSIFSSDLNKSSKAFGGVDFSTSVENLFSQQKGNR